MGVFNTALHEKFLVRARAVSNTMRVALLLLAAAGVAGQVESSSQVADDDVALLTCLTQVRLYPGVQVHDRHPAIDLGNRPNVSSLDCAEWCCMRADCLAWYHTTAQKHDGLNCKAGQSCCWLKPTFNTTRIHDAGDCDSEHHCMSGVRGDGVASQ